MRLNVLGTFGFTRVIMDQSKIERRDFHTIRTGALALSDVLTYYGQLRDYVKHEDELINSRLSWSLTIDGFLFTAYGVLLGQAFGIEAKSTVAAAASGAVPFLFFLALPIVAVGAVISIFSRNSITAAHNAIQYLNAIAHDGALKIDPGSVAADDRRYYVTELAQPAVVHALVDAPDDLIRLPRIISGGDRFEYTRGGHAYYLALPIVMLGVWILLGLAALYLGLRASHAI